MNIEYSQGWALDKKINVSNMLTACVVATSVIWWAAQIEKRIAVLEVELKAFYEAQLQTKEFQGNRDVKQDVAVDKLESIIRKDFDRLHATLDSLKKP